MDFKESVKAYENFRKWGYYKAAIEQLEFISKNFYVDTEAILINKAWCCYKDGKYTESYMIAKDLYKLYFNETALMIKDLSFKKMNIKIVK